MNALRKTGGLFAALLLAGGSGRAEENPIADSDARANKLQAGIRVFEADFEAFREKMREAGAEERREMAANAPDPKPLATEAQKFVLACQEHEEVPGLAAWVLMWKRDADFPALYEALGRHHLDRSEIAPALIFIGAGVDRSPESKAFLEGALERSSNAQVMGAAAYGLANRLRRAAGDDEQAERRKLLQTAIDGLGDLEVRGQKVKERAEGQLFALEHLALGKVAPEIEGEDTAGVKFKLSDYRGKVVVIDFWGDW